MNEWSDAEFVRRATQASNAFEDLRRQLRVAHAEQAAPAAGDVIGRYRIVQELGQGGFGSVYEVQHDLLGHRFAMKLLNPRVAADPAWVTRFREEARITSLIGHENIVYVTDFGEDDVWGSFFVMEYLDGEPLDRTIERERQLTAERVARFAHAAASALAAVHEVGIVHCDLKPSNVFSVRRDRQGEVWKLLDFGTSTVVMDAVETEVLYGTPLYMAPEQSIGGDITPQCDQFSIACIMYEMLTGQTPWEVKNWLMASPEIRSRNPPKPPSDLSPLCPKSWDDVILRGLAIDPADRWSSLDSLARALAEQLEIAWKPVADPFDQRLGQGQNPPTGASGTSLGVRIHEGADGPSVVVDLETGEETDERTTVRVEFRGRERFNREAHRNLSVGGMFIPSEELLSLREPVQVEIVFGPTGLSCKLGAVVVGHELRRETGRGFGVAFDASDRTALDEFIESVRAPGLGAQTVLSRTDADVPQTLTPGEWFVLSRIDPGTKFNYVKSLCAGLPFEIDDIVATLIEQGLVKVVTKSGQGHVGSYVEPQLARTMKPDDVQAVLERVDFYRYQANYLSASDVLRRAIEVSPRVAVFHHRLALLRLEFEGEAHLALPAAREAARLEPDNEVYRKLMNSLRSGS